MILVQLEQSVFDCYVAGRYIGALMLAYADDLVFISIIVTAGQIEVPRRNCLSDSVRNCCSGAVEGE